MTGVFKDSSKSLLPEMSDILHLGDWEGLSSLIEEVTDRNNCLEVTFFNDLKKLFKFHASSPKFFKFQEKLKVLLRSKTSEDPSNVSLIWFVFLFLYDEEYKEISPDEVIRYIEDMPEKLLRVVFYFAELAKVDSIYGSLKEKGSLSPFLKEVFMIFENQSLSMLSFDEGSEKLDKDKKLRVALCFSGQMRGWKDSIKSWIDYFQYEPNVDFDVYIHTWKQAGSKVNASSAHVNRIFPEGHFLTEYKRFFSKYQNKVRSEVPTLFKMAKKISGEISEESLSKIPQLKEVVVEDECNSKFLGYTNQDKMHYKIYKCHELSVSSGVSYDLIVRLRPDRSIKQMDAGFSLVDAYNYLRKNKAIFADQPFSINNLGFMGDQIALGTPAVMGVYARCWLDSKSNGKMFFFSPKELTGHASLAWQCCINDILVHRLPAKLLPLSNSKKLTAKDILRALKKDQVRASVSLNSLISAVKKDIDDEV